VIHVAHVLTGLGRGGAERVVADLAARSDRSRFRHSLFYLRGPHDLADEIRASGCQVICLDVPERLGWGAAVPKLRRQIKALKPDLLHTATFEANVAARIAALGTGVPLVAWLVSMEYDPDAVRAAGWSLRSNEARRMLDALTARVAKPFFVACSGAVAASARARLHIPPPRMEVIYNPVEVAAVEAAAAETAEARASLGIGETDFIWLSIGRLDLPKGHRFLIDAFARSAARQPDSHLVLIGKGPAAADLASQAEALGLSGRVHLVSWAERTGPFLQAADAFVFPSLLEGLPVALLEAMCAGLPCIASDIPPHVELLEQGHTGLLVAQGSAEALAEAMIGLQGDAALQHRLGEAGKAECRGRFTTATIVPQWESLFERLAAARA
jgi:glycosyltransferase involved in cell wall biosynthesis